MIIVNISEIYKITIDIDAYYKSQLRDCIKEYAYAYDIKTHGII